MQTDWQPHLFDTVTLAKLSMARERVTYGWRSDWPKDDDEHYVVDARYVASGRPSIC
jgi:hypothetical protein